MSETTTSTTASLRRLVPRLFSRAQPAGAGRCRVIAPSQAKENWHPAACDP